jgi:hypothetical protein
MVVSIKKGGVATPTFIRPIVILWVSSEKCCLRILFSGRISNQEPCGMLGSSVLVFSGMLTAERQQ